MNWSVITTSSPNCSDHQDQASRILGDDQEQQADIIWETLFVRNTPISEACRGVVCVLNALGLDPGAEDLTEAREYFASVDVDEHITNVLDIANVSDVVMTNDPFHPLETKCGVERSKPDKRFHAALRMDPLINDWENVSKREGFKERRTRASSSTNGSSG